MDESAAGAAEWKILRNELIRAREALRTRLHLAGRETLTAVAVIEREVEHLGVAGKDCAALRLEVMRLQAIVARLDD